MDFDDVIKIWRVTDVISKFRWDFFEDNVMFKPPLSSQKMPEVWKVFSKLDKSQKPCPGLFCYFPWRTFFLRFHIHQNFTCILLDLYRRGRLQDHQCETPGRRCPCSTPFNSAEVCQTHRDVGDRDRHRRVGYRRCGCEPGWILYRYVHCHQSEKNQCRTQGGDELILKNMNCCLQLWFMLLY